MAGPAIPVAVFAALALLYFVKVYGRGRALRTRGVRVPATCVNTRNGPSGTTYLLVQFTAGDGARLQTTVGPFAWPPARVGGALEVVYDPNDTTNLVTPDEVTNGRTPLAFAIGSGALLLLCCAVIVIDLAG